MAIVPTAWKLQAGVLRTICIVLLTVWLVLTDVLNHLSLCLLLLGIIPSELIIKYPVSLLLFAMLQEALSTVLTCLGSSQHSFKNMHFMVDIKSPR